MNWQLRGDGRGQHMSGKGDAQLVRVVNLRSLVFGALGVFLAYRILDLIAVTVLLFTIAFFLAIILDRPIRWLDRRGFSRGISVGLIALSILAGMALTVYFGLPPLANQAAEFARDAPQHIERLQTRAEGLAAPYPFIREHIRSANLPEQATRFAQSLLPQIGRYSLTFLTGLFGLFLVFILTLFTVADPKPLVRGALFALPQEQRKPALRILLRVSAQLQAWVRATFWMMLTIGVLGGMGMWMLGVKNPLLFGLIAGIGEAIPTVGPILSVIPPFLATLGDDPMKAVWVLVFFAVLQQVENNLLVPRIMAATMKLHPVSVMFFTVAMAALLGPVGMLLAVPLCAIIKVVYQETWQRRKKVGPASRTRERERTAETDEVVTP